MDEGFSRTAGRPGSVESALRASRTQSPSTLRCSKFVAERPNVLMTAGVWHLELNKLSAISFLTPSAFFSSPFCGFHGLLVSLFLGLRRRRGSAPTRAPHKHWNVHDLKKSTPAEKGRTPPSSHGLSLIQQVVHALVLTFWNKQNAEGLEKKEHRHSEEGTKCSNSVKATKYSSEQALYSKEKKLGLTDSLPSGPSFTTLSLQIPSLSITVTACPRREKGFPCCARRPGSGNPATRPHACPGTKISRAMWQLKATLPSSNLPGRDKSFHLTSFAPKHSEQGFPHCARTAQMKKCLHFQSMTQRHCPSQGSLGNRISTCLQSQEG